MSKYHDVGAYMERGLKDVAFYVQKHKTPRAVCYNFQLVREFSDDESNELSSE